MLSKGISQNILSKITGLSINTIRNHIANIYRKTGMNKKELREKCFYGT